MILYYVILYYIILYIHIQIQVSSSWSFTALRLTRWAADPEMLQLLVF